MTVAPLPEHLRDPEDVAVENMRSSCSVTFATNGTLNSHINRKSVRRFICGTCSQVVNLNEDLRRHARSIHVDETLPRGETLRCTNETCEDAKQGVEEGG